MKHYLKRLLPAANAMSLVAALGHAIAVAIAGGIGLELVYIAVLTYFVAIVAAVPAGAVLLAIVGFFRINLVVSLLFFLVAVQSMAVWLEMYFFEIGLADISWQYGFISVPASLTAWYFSVYYVWKNQHDSSTHKL